jgi:lysosomal acid lipase/cholesteryl ester hydrolase
VSPNICEFISYLSTVRPTFLFLIFGRKAILSSAPAWQSLLYPPVFVSAIDSSLRWLFNWSGRNISSTQKYAAYAHLYSFASVKSVVHWFQIMRNGKFQMYDDDVQQFIVARGGRHRPSGVSSYAPARFPTKNIITPIVLLYGDSDSLVDINQMLHELPEHTTATPLYTYEHLDILWGENVDQEVFPYVVENLKKYCPRPERLQLTTKINGTHYEPSVVETTGSGYSTPSEPECDDLEDSSA